MLRLIIDNTLHSPTQERLLTEEEEQDNILDMLLTQGIKNKTPLLLGNQWRLIDNALLL